jgi:hypothetical protein
LNAKFEELAIKFKELHKQVNEEISKQIKEINMNVRYLWEDMKILNDKIEEKEICKN